MGWEEIRREDLKTTKEFLKNEHQNVTKRKQEKKKPKKPKSNKAKTRERNEIKKKNKKQRGRLRSRVQRANGCDKSSQKYI